MASAPLLQAIGVPSGEGPLATAEADGAESAARAFEARARTALQAAPPYHEWLNQALAG